MKKSLVKSPAHSQGQFPYLAVSRGSATWERGNSEIPFLPLFLSFPSLSSPFLCFPFLWLQRRAATSKTETNSLYRQLPIGVAREIERGNGGGKRRRLGVQWVQEQELRLQVVLQPVQAASASCRHQNPRRLQVAPAYRRLDLHRLVGLFVYYDIFVCLFWILVPSIRIFVMALSMDIGACLGSRVFQRLWIRFWLG